MPKPKLSESEEKLLQQFTADMRELQNRPPIVMHIHLFELWAAMSYIQLALRHPGATGPVAEAARQIAEQFAEAASITPTLAKVARDGFNPAKDQPYE